uniref:Uncharacterized protein n=1 Tax=Helianthus annuus TaxID=4232 RepID=A0A251THC1_HELAN
MLVGGYKDLDSSKRLNTLSFLVMKFLELSKIIIHTFKKLKSFILSYFYLVI